jgi:hypothetical protein
VSVQRASIHDLRSSARVLPRRKLIWGQATHQRDLLAVPGGCRGVDRVEAEVARIVAEVGRAADTVVADDGRWAGTGLADQGRCLAACDEDPRPCFGATA